MAKVNNATGVYSTLGYSFSDPNKNIQVLSIDAQDHLNSIPPIIEAWQAKDIANNSVNGYYQNPSSIDITTIIAKSNLIAESANTIGDTALATSANTLNLSARSFLDHTNRISGVTVFDPVDTVNPYLENAMAYGKTAMYLTNQTDGIVDTSPTMGSFTSLFIGPQVKSSANTIALDSDSIDGSITSSSVTDPETGNTTTTYSSTLTPTEITTIIGHLDNTNSLINGRQTSDVSFFTNTKDMVNKYNTLKQFSNMGESQEYLIKNFIGTPKLLSRINS